MKPSKLVCAVSASLTANSFRSVLVTGGAGYFGRAFVAAALQQGVDRVCVYSRDEAKHAAMKQEIRDERVRWFVGDVRDRDRLRRAMQGCDAVVHAAALKRVEVGQYNPTEMVRTNVGGAENVVWAACEAGVRRVVALSTDKAFEPCNTYGKTKALAEDIFLGANIENPHGPMFAVTRYGNVAGSTGSVIPTWRAQIAAGLELTVRDVNATRFWMTIDEAVELVIRTLRTMRGGELVIPELPAYRLGDLLAAMDTRNARMRVVPLGQGEKLHEGMAPGKTSDRAPRMTVEDIREALRRLDAPLRRFEFSQEVPCTIPMA